MTKKHDLLLDLILKLKGISREMKAAIKLMIKIDGTIIKSNAVHLKYEARLIDLWIQEIKKEIENDKTK